ncbi:hypothetical protein Tco_0829679 [Tanacetum coccineum]
MAGPVTNDYISATRKSFVSNEKNGKMIEKNFIEIEGTFLVKIQDNAFNEADGKNMFEHINSFLEVVDPLKVRGLKEEAEDDDDPDEIDEVPEIFKIEDGLFSFDTPLCIAFEEFNNLLKIDPSLFTYDIQVIKTYDEYKQELNNDKAQGLDEKWSNNGVAYQLCDHICEPYRFKNEITKWPTCSSDIDGYCNGGGLPGMVRVGHMTYFQDHKWYDNLIDGCLKQETLVYKARIEGSWGDATPSVMKFYTWLNNSFKNFHELAYDVLVKLDECLHTANYGVTCEDEAKRRNSGTKTKTFKENYYLLPYVISSKEDTTNYGVTCEDEAKRRNSGTKTKTFEENCYLLLYAVSNKEDTAYQ